MARTPIVVARATLITGSVLFALGITALASQGFSDWWWLLTPLMITTLGITSMRRVHKYGTIVPTPKHATRRTR